jgi:methoxymalonate biosynthesis acyl carrier protein
VTTHEIGAAEALEDQVQAELLEFINKRTGIQLQVDTDLFNRGLISSMFAMELVVHVEETFGIDVEGPDLAIDNFRTVQSMIELVRRLRGAASAQ